MNQSTIEGMFKSMENQNGSKIKKDIYVRISEITTVEIQKMLAKNCESTEMGKFKNKFNLNNMKFYLWDTCQNSKFKQNSETKSFSENVSRLRGLNRINFDANLNLDQVLEDRVQNNIDVVVIDPEDLNDAVQIFTSWRSQLKLQYNADQALNPKFEGKNSLGDSSRNSNPL